ncbi:MAG: DJ-1/PfpI family protein [Candidatus Aenigmarchaeota archaeon]|nr:DJ-1/PfpI family protein [Candidatus Aenigmarchaeota archaeon]
MARILLVIAPENFRDEEYFHTKEELEATGIETETASKRMGECMGMLGKAAVADITLDAADIDDYDGIIFVGGTGSSVYFEDENALEMAKKAFEKGKIAAAICMAPSILANAGILNGKRATAYQSEEENLKNKGAEYTGEPVTIDGNIVTGNGPEAARDFGKEIARAME